MSYKSWHASLGPKVRGTWNIHDALHGRHQELDFLLLTSSKYGSVGHVTQSNYCSANAFLDAFASYRRQLGLPAISLALGMVSEIGYVHEHPEIEAALQRKGVNAITEEELVLLFDIALSSDLKKSQGAQLPATGHKVSVAERELQDTHLLTGFELVKSSANGEQFLEANDFTPNDPRASILVKLLNSRLNSSNSTETEDPANLEGVAGRIHSAIVQNDDEAARQIVQEVFQEKLGDMLRISAPEAQLGDQVKLMNLGLDSMLATEIRTWIWQTFAIDVPFFLLLEPKTTLGSLMGFMVNALTAEERDPKSGRDEAV